MAKATIPVLIDWNSIKDYMAQNDVIQVIRCKDCKWYYGDYCGGFGDGAFTPEDGFCHNAERKSE